MTPDEFLREPRDVTDEKHAEGRLRGLALAASAITAAAASLAGALQVITDHAREIIGAHQSVTSVTIDQNWARAVHAFSLSDKYARYRTYDAKADGSGIYSLVCRENRTMRMTQAELEAHPAWRGFGKEAEKHPPMRGWLAAPLTARDGTNLGLIQLSDKYEGEFTEEDEAILIQLAQLASRSIERHRAALVRWGRLSSSREKRSV